MTGSLCHAAEIDTTMQTNCTLIKKDYGLLGEMEGNTELDFIKI